MVSWTGKVIGLREGEPFFTFLCPSFSALSYRSPPSSPLNMDFLVSAVSLSRSLTISSSFPPPWLERLVVLAINLFISFACGCATTVSRFRNLSGHRTAPFICILSQVSHYICNKSFTPLGAEGLGEAPSMSEGGRPTHRRTLQFIVLTY
jgi:hypothetical protein